MNFERSAKRRFTEGYGFFIAFLVLLLGLSVCLLSAAPPPWRAGVLAFMCGAAVAAAEIVSRYRDEPLHAMFTPFGLVYLLFNGAIALGLLAVVLKYREQLSLPANLDPFWAAILAGFGSTALMRTRLAVIRGADNKDISIGPDIVVKTLLQMTDQYIDRARASARLEIVVRHIEDIASLGSQGTGPSNFAQAADYLLASLLAFQNLDEERKKQLKEVMSAYAQQPLPDPIKYFALGFVFLTVSGERQFEDVVRNAILTKKSGEQKPAPLPSPLPAGSAP
jgi:hypothetical protein